MDGPHRGWVVACRHFEISLRAPLPAEYSALMLAALLVQVNERCQGFSCAVVPWASLASQWPSSPRKQSPRAGRWGLCREERRPPDPAHHAISRRPLRGVRARHQLLQPGWGWEEHRRRAYRGPMVRAGVERHGSDQAGGSPAGVRRQRGGHGADSGRAARSSPWRSACSTSAARMRISPSG